VVKISEFNDENQLAKIPDLLSFTRLAKAPRAVGNLPKRDAALPVFLLKRPQKKKDKT